MNQHDLDWLPELTSQLTPPRITERTLFDLLGVSTRELPISRVLAYYLDENEAHGLGRLFLDSLLVCMNKDSNDFPSPYRVVREWSNIDILIKGEAGDWAVILENKINHVLNNDLAKYWRDVTANHKAGVVVTLNEQSLENYVPEEGSDFNFVNVTHLAWLEQVKHANPNLINPYPDVRQWVLINDFLTTMENTTNALKDAPSINRNIRLLQAYSNDIGKVVEAQKAGQEYVRKLIHSVFAGYGFDERKKGFFFDNREAVKKTTDAIPPFRFFVADTVVTDNHLGVYFELHGSACQDGNTYRDAISTLIEPLGLKTDEHQNQAKQFYHLAITKEVVLVSDNDDLPEKLAAIIGKFFKPIVENKSLVDYCIDLWKQKHANSNESV
ncbi:PD-(D/E)XK nuclease family protein [Spirosoma sp. KUDC1026]|uniref:PD-(D/E)XK nuclease family protein n=1 Tax=Spirosoma sp. KUDC1026 TaxID=2745947 RepID=UPI00159BA753|nr:PD-(D/E)XK nuclease family protein [Spirosoma sp. KUDC1026]QKZ12713.1 PD-(D/E)XK nuclease family protein [Spirosoma sp. KUDC1026]